MPIEVFEVNKKPALVAGLLFVLHQIQNDLCLLSATIRATAVFRQILNALGAQGTAHHGSLFENLRLLKVRLEQTLGFLLGKRNILTEFRLFPTILTLGHFTIALFAKMMSLEHQCANDHATISIW